MISSKKAKGTKFGELVRFKRIDKSGRIFKPTRRKDLGLFVTRKGREFLFKHKLLGKGSLLRKADLTKGFLDGSRKLTSVKKGKSIMVYLHEGKTRRPFFVLEKIKVKEMKECQEVINKINSLKLEGPKFVLKPIDVYFVEKTHNGVHLARKFYREPTVREMEEYLLSERGPIEDETARSFERKYGNLFSSIFSDTKPGELIGASFEAYTKLKKFRDTNKLKFNITDSNVIVTGFDPLKRRFTFIFKGMINK
ncbi:MAG: hypothetical protein ABIE23_01600 [archaeon]